MRRALIASRRPTSLVGKDHLGHWLNDKSPQSRHFGAGNGVNPAWFTFNLGSGFSFAKNTQRNVNAAGRIMVF